MGVGGREGPRRVGRPRASSQTYRGSGAASEISSACRSPQSLGDRARRVSSASISYASGFADSSSTLATARPRARPATPATPSTKATRRRGGIPIQVRFRHVLQKASEGLSFFGVQPCLDLRRCETWSCDRLVAGPGSRPRPIPASNPFTTHSPPHAPSAHPIFFPAVPRAQTL